MKNFKTIAIALLVAFSATTGIAQNKKIDIEKSKINWVGKKVTGQHSGTINFSSGTLVFVKKQLKGGVFVADMTSLTVTDLQPGKGKEGLEKHLKNDDFFGTDKHKEAKIEFKKINKNNDGTYNVTADLTIKGITTPVNFKMTTGANTATTTFKVDRTKYDIKFKSKSFFENLGDNVIDDEFELTVNLVF